MLSIDDIKHLNVADLRERARTEGIPGYYNMNKIELVKSLFNQEVLPQHYKPRCMSNLKEVVVKEARGRGIDVDRDIKVILKTKKELCGGMTRTELDQRRCLRQLKADIMTQAIDKGVNIDKKILHILKTKKSLCEEIDGKSPSRRKTSARRSKKRSKSKTCPTEGFVIAVGNGEDGQLGLGPEIGYLISPRIIQSLPKDIVQVCAGGMHSVCLSAEGTVYTFGEGAKGALGRISEDEEDYTYPDKVDIIDKIIMVSAGDSHTAMLSDDGSVYVCGTFTTAEAGGDVGMIPGNKKQLDYPTRIMHKIHVIKIASGYHHLVCLAENGEVWTLGAGEMGQLGRNETTIKTVKFLKNPEPVFYKGKKLRCVDIWAGGFVTFAKDINGKIFAWGLNSSKQLGMDLKILKTPPPLKKNEIFTGWWFEDCYFTPTPVDSFGDKNWVEISSSSDHTLALDSRGKVYSFGNGKTGKLGLGEDITDTEEPGPTLIPKLRKIKFVNVNCGDNVSHAVSEDRKLYIWGANTTYQLGVSDEDIEYFYEPEIFANIKKVKVIMASGGGQHSLFLVYRDDNS